MLHPNKPKSTPFIHFLGGVNTLFGLIVLVLSIILIYLLGTISYMFNPFFVMLTAIGTPLILGIIFYYMFIPLVDKLEEWKVPRSVGAIISLLLLIGLFIGFVGVAAPIIVGQIVAFAQALPIIINNFISILQRLSATYEFQSYYNQIIDWVNNSLSSIVNQFLLTLGSTLQGLSVILSALSNVIIILMTFPIFLFFLLIDGRSFKNNFLKWFPQDTREEIDNLFHQINKQVGGYIKGRLLTSFLIGVYFFIAYSVIGLNYTFVLAFLAGLLSLIPYIGSLIALVPVFIIAATQSSFTVILVLILWGFGQILDGNVLGPIIIGKNLNMHPLTIIVVLIGFGTLMGISGMIMGIPIYAISRIFIKFLFTKFKRRYARFFNDNGQKY